jgi:hypothetical protein
MTVVHACGFRVYSGERPLLFDKERKGFTRGSGTQYVGIAFQKPKMIKVG